MGTSDGQQRQGVERRMESWRNGETDDQGMIELIQEAALAGCYWTLARTNPGGRSGFYKLAVLHSERVGALTDQISRESAELASKAPSPTVGVARQRRA
jgi:hypothetical protein